MNMIVNGIPYYVVINGKKYSINTDYRVMINFEKIVQDNELSNEEKIFVSLQNFYPAFFEIANNGYLEEAAKQMLWFYKCGKEEDKKKRTMGSAKNGKKIYDYDYDAQYIFSAFYQDYRIDLTKSKLHWWKFKAMLLSLKEDNQFIKILGYRNYKGKDDEMKKLKKYYEIPVSKSEQERLGEIEELLAKKG